MPQTEGELSQAKLAQHLGTTAASVCKRAKRRGVGTAEYLIELAAKAGEVWEVSRADSKTTWLKRV